MGRNGFRGWPRALVAVGVTLVTALGASGTALAAFDEGQGDADLSGTVVDGSVPATPAVGGVVVCLADVDNSVCKVTDGGGHYAFSQVPQGDYTLSATPPVGTNYLTVGTDANRLDGYIPIPAIPVQLSSPGSHTQDVELYKGGRISVAVTQPDGSSAAVGEPSVICRTDAAGPGACPDQIPIGVTDGLGRATSAVILPGVYRVTAGDADGSTGFPVTVTGQEVFEDDVTDVPIRLIAGGAISGSVRDADTNPVSGATISIGISPNQDQQTQTDGTGAYSFPSLAPGTYTGTVSPPFGNASLDSVLTGPITVTENGSAVADFVLPRATLITGTAATDGSFSPFAGGVLVCGNSATPSLTAAFAPTCSDGSGAGVVPVPPSTFTYKAPGAGTYTLRLAYIYDDGGTTTAAYSPPTTIVVAAGEAVECTLVAGTPGSATCGGPPPPATGTVIYTIDEPQVSPPAAGYYPGFCADPGLPQLGNLNCTDGRPAIIDFGVAGGATLSRELLPGTYNAAMADPTLGSLSPIRSLTVVSGLTTVCTFTLANGPVCTVNDGDGIDEPPPGYPADYDGNGDGIADAEQANVTSLIPAVGSAPVTIAAPDGATLTNVTAEALPGSPTPPAGADFPVGLLGFSVVLPSGATSADVEIHLPAGSSPNAYYKLVSGAYQQVPLGAGPGTTVAFAGDVVTLHLVDDDGVFDTDPAPGIIGDPGGPAMVDQTGPTVTCPAPPVFVLHAPGATISAAVADDGSGPDPSTATATVDTSVAGPGSVDLTGRDLAGNETTVSCGYTVEYHFDGFSWPVDNHEINVVTAGRNVPIGWRLTDAYGFGVSDPASFVSLTAAPVACPAAPTDRIELTLPFALTPRHVLAGIWLGTWKAPRPAPSDCLELRLALGDGTTHTAVFQVT